MPYLKGLESQRLISSRVKVINIMKNFLFRGPLIVLVCLAIGFAIVWGGEWLLQQLGFLGH